MRLDVCHGHLGRFFFFFFSFLPPFSVTHHAQLPEAATNKRQLWQSREIDTSELCSGGLGRGLFKNLRRHGGAGS